VVGLLETEILPREAPFSCAFKQSGARVG